MTIPINLRYYWGRYSGPIDEPCKKCDYVRGGNMLTYTKRRFSMRAFLIVAVLFIFPAFVSAQNGFAPIVDLPLDFDQVTTTEVFVMGHWVALNEKSKLAGPAISTITCSRQERTCQDQHAEMMIMGDTFVLTSDQDEYKIERWTSTEIVASSIGGLCRVRSVIKLDLVKHRVLLQQTLSEPISSNLPKMSQDICAAGNGLLLELRGAAPFGKSGNGR